MVVITPDTQNSVSTTGHRMSYIQAELGMPPNFKSALDLDFVQKGGADPNLLPPNM